MQGLQLSDTYRHAYDTSLNPKDNTTTWSHHKSLAGKEAFSIGL